MMQIAYNEFNSKHYVLTRPFELQYLMVLMLQTLQPWTDAPSRSWQISAHRTVELLP